MNTQIINITYTSPNEKPKAEELALAHGLTLIEPSEMNEIPCLVQTPSYLGTITAANQKPIHIDFLSPQWQYRLRQSSLRKELLAKAIGLTPKLQPTIIDATAGLARDGFLLAALGHEITLIERSTVIYLLVCDALARAQENSSLHPIVGRIQLVHADALDYIPGTKPDIIYLDPMFPEKKKNAAPKKEIVLLKNLLETNNDADELLTLAQSCATKRIVVKRPRLGGFLAMKTPDFSLTGSSSRFDIYLQNPPLSSL